MSNNPSAEALSLLGLVADAQKFRSRLEELISKTEAADKATLALQAAEKATAEATASKLQVAEALLQSLQDQTSAIQEKNSEAEVKLTARAKEVAEREAAVTEREKKNADEVALSLDMFKERESDLKQRQSVLDSDFHRRLEDLRGVENKLRDHHSGLRSIIGETQARIAAAS